MAMSGQESKKVLITVKTYPTISRKYEELVCTAGVNEKGEWIRIYPIPYRKKPYSQQYKKFEWIKLDLIPNQSDFRPESYRPASAKSPIKTVGKIGTGTKTKWRRRKELVTRQVYTNLEELWEEAKDPNYYKSLATFKPSKFKKFVHKKVSDTWPKDKLDALRQGNLFESDISFQVVKKLPFKFSYVIEDDSGRESTMMIEDWEIGALYWKCLNTTNGNKTKAAELVKQRYWDWIVKKRDPYLFLGTTQAHHLSSKNPFVIIGVFYPPIDNQQKLFERS